MRSCEDVCFEECQEECLYRRCPPPVGALADIHEACFSSCLNYCYNECIEKCKGLGSKQ